MTYVPALNPREVQQPVGFPALPPHLLFAPRERKKADPHIGVYGVRDAYEGSQKFFLEVSNFLHKQSETVARPLPVRRETGVGIRGRTFFLLGVGSKVFLECYNLLRGVHPIPLAAELELNGHILYLTTLKGGLLTLRVVSVKPKSMARRVAKRIRLGNFFAHLDSKECLIQHYSL